MKFLKKETEAVKSRAGVYSDFSKKAKADAERLKDLDVKGAAQKEKETIESGTVNSKYEGSLKRFCRTTTTLITILCIAAVLYSIVGIVLVSGDSMNDTYEHGQLLIQTYPLSVSKGDVITFYTDFSGEEKILIKRVIATEGDTICSDGENVYVNGEALEEDYIIGTTSEFEELTVSEGCIFVMGDNRENSLDSRAFGEVELSDVYGVILGGHRWEE